MKILAWIISGFVMIGLTGCSSQIVTQALERADERITEKQYEEALSGLQQALLQKPTSQKLLTKKAEIIRIQRDYTGFLALWPSLEIQTLRTHPELMRHRIVALIKTDKAEQAATQIDNLLRREPASPDRLQLKGQLLYLQGDITQAIQLYDQALAQDPTHTEALVNKWVALADQGNLVEWLALLDQALQASPDDYLIRYNKGTVLSDLWFQQKTLAATGAFSYFSDALRHFEKAYMLNPDHTSTLVRLGITYLDLSETTKAHSALDVALSQDPMLIDARYYKGKTYAAEQNYPEAKKTFEHLLTIDPTYELAQQELIDIEEKQPPLKGGPDSSGGSWNKTQE